MKLLLILFLAMLSTSFSQVSLLILNSDEVFGDGTLGDVTISSTVNLANNGNEYIYNNLTITPSGRILIQGDGNNSAENIIVIKVKNNLIINGIIEGKSGSHAGGSFYKVINPLNIRLGKNVIQQNGGSGYNGQAIGWTSELGNVSSSSPAYGNGGGGGGSNGDYNGCSGPDKAIRGADATPDRGGNGGQGGEGGGGGGGGYIYSNSGGSAGHNGCGGGGGGGGGARGIHGNLIIIIANNISGSGSINISGSNGGAGGNGGSGGAGGTGGGGGGGAGGNGGTIWFVSKNNNYTGTFNLSGGSGGNGGSGYGGYAPSGNNGLIGQVINIDLFKK